MDQNLLTLGHTVGCTLLLIFSFLILCPLAVLLRNFKGHCIIGASITFPSNLSGTEAETIAQDNVAAHSKCTYPEFMGFALLFFSIVYLVWNTFLIINSWQSPGRDCFIGAILSGLFSFMLLVSSSILSSGINQVCHALKEGHHSCTYDNMRTDHWLVYLNVDNQIVTNLETEKFYSLIKISEVSSWLAFLTMLAMFVVYMLKLKTSQQGMEFVSGLTSERTRIVSSSDAQKRYDQI